MDAQITAYERAFRRAGLPRFIRQFTAWEDVFTRVTPLLVLISLLEVVLALNTQWPWWANTLVILAGLALVCAGLALLSRRRTGRWSLLPSRVGRPEIAFFIAVPPLIQVAGGGQWPLLPIGIGLNLVLLGIIYVFTAFGVIPTMLATFTRAAGELAASLGRLVRTLPFLLIFSVVLFINTEMWQVFAAMSGPAMIALTCVFVLIIGSLISVRLPSLITSLEAEIREGSDGAPTPAQPGEEAPDAAPEVRAGVPGPALDRAERNNVGILLWVSQLTQVMGVAAGLGLFFCLFGMLTVSETVLTQWVGDASIGWTWHLSLGPSSLLFSNVHLRVAFAIACLTGVYYAVTIMADRSYRREFLAGLADELAPVFAQRTAYRAALASPVSQDAQSAKK